MHVVLVHDASSGAIRLEGPFADDAAAHEHATDLRENDAGDAIPLMVHPPIPDLVRS